MLFPAHQLKKPIQELAATGVRIGTSSWKYKGWLGNLYDEQRYLHGKKFSQKKFESECLSEYSEVFKTVSVDAGYYQFPTAEMLAGWREQVPEDFLFCFKAPSEITSKHFPKISRLGSRGGQMNPHYLNTELFAEKFLAPCEAMRSQIGLLMFEFSHLSARDYTRGRDFVADLDGFLERLPKGWQYGVEVRNANLLAPAYFETLRRHQVAHIYNQWGKMPAVAEQMAMPESQTTDFCAARFLLKPGRTYEQAVRLFSPYERVQEPDPVARQSAVHLVRHAQKKAKRPSFVFFNNRFEGNALGTVKAIFEQL